MHGIWTTNRFTKRGVHRVCLFILLIFTLICYLSPGYAKNKTKHRPAQQVHKKVLPAKLSPHKLAQRKKTKWVKHSKVTQKLIAIHKQKRVLVKKERRANIHENNISYNTNLPVYLMNAKEQRVIRSIHKTVSTLRYTHYKLGGTYINPERGVYVVDCSTYVDHVLKSLYPHAFSSLVAWSRTEKPTSDDFYDYFVNLDRPKRHWSAVDTVSELRPGDVLVFRYKNSRGNETGGHVMIVMDKPTPHPDGYSVRVADSAPSGHSKDTRSRHESGIGVGTLLLKVHPRTYQPYAYAWKVGANWKTNVYVAMARPIDSA